MKLSRLVNEIKLYLKNFHELNERFPDEFAKSKDQIDEIEQNARKIIEEIDQIRNTWNEEEYEKDMAIICETSDEEQNI
ncbi:unnamed protein product [Litomosoides sigmodontis]|uniref:Tubulin-specific chaperone A n=1 Tax=Litomosoides sigmodontis TaxID=42156 RepID=A0A3P6TIS9_LITSI|nr:unnamed protein product [Litomosoides sigmodontis]